VPLQSLAGCRGAAAASCVVPSPTPATCRLQGPCHRRSPDGRHALGVNGSFEVCANAGSSSSLRCFGLDLSPLGSAFTAFPRVRLAATSATAGYSLPGLHLSLSAPGLPPGPTPDPGSNAEAHNQAPLLRFRCPPAHRGGGVLRPTGRSLQAGSNRSSAAGPAGPASVPPVPFVPASATCSTTRPSDRSPGQGAPGLCCSSG